MNTTNTKKVYEWKYCPHEWGLEDYLIVESSHGKIILCEVVYDEEGYIDSCEPVNAGDIGRI